MIIERPKIMREPVGAKEWQMSNKRKSLTNFNGSKPPSVDQSSELTEKKHKQILTIE
jgi:hypothetical protein